jgi:hypothetical protein
VKHPVLVLGLGGKMLVRTLLFLSVLGLMACGKSEEPLTDVAPDDTGQETDGSDSSSDSATEEEAVFNNMVGCRERAEGDGESDYVKNKGKLCVVTSEVNWKIGKGILEGGDKAVKLRDCMATCLEKIDSGQTDSDGSTQYCQGSNGFTNNDTCWAELAKCEKECGGPEVGTTDGRN